MKKTLAIILAVLFASTPCYGQFVTGGGGGGTSLSGGTQYYLTAWNGADSVTKLAALGSAGNPLVSAGAGALPAWLAIVMAGGTNTFSITNGTASLDVAAGATLNIDKSLQVATGAVVINGNAGGASVLTLPNQTTVVGTLTDGKWCSYASAGTTLSCTQDAPAGSGDVTGVGDCTDGACYDGSSDGGTYIRLYDGTSAYESITGGVRLFTFASSTADAENLILTLGANDNTVTLSSGTGAATLNLNAFSVSSNGLVPDAADGAALGSATLEWSDLYLADGGKIYFQNDQSVYLTPSAGVLTLTGQLATTGGIDTTAATTTGGYIRLKEGSDNGTDYSSITGAANAGSYPAFTFGGSQGSEDLTLTAASNLWTFASTTSALIAFTPDVSFTGDITVGGADITLKSDGVKLTGSNGSLTILGLGDGQDEDLKIDLNTTANTIEITSPASSATTIDINTLNLVSTGTIQGGVVISSDADGMDAAAMTAAGMYGTMFIATGAGTWILPRAALGMSACLMDSGTAHDLILDVTAGSTIRLKGTEGSDGVGITNASGTSTGDFVCVIAVATDKWSTVGMQGTWASQ